MKAYVLINIRTGEIKDAVRQMRKAPQVREANMTWAVAMPLPFWKPETWMIWETSRRPPFSPFPAWKRPSPAWRWI